MGKYKNHRSGFSAVLSLLLTLLLLAGCAAGAPDQESPAAESETVAKVPEFVLLAFFKKEDPFQSAYYLQYDEAGRVTQVRSLDLEFDTTFSAAYDESGRLVEETHVRQIDENNVGPCYSYDESGQLSEIRTENTYYITTQTITHDENGQVRSVNQTVELTEKAKQDGTDPGNAEPTIWEYEIHENSDGGKTVTVTIVSVDGSPALSQTYGEGGAVSKPFLDEWQSDAFRDYAQVFWDAFHIYEVEQDQIPEFCYVCASEIRNPDYYIGSETDDVIELDSGYVITRQVNESGAAVEKTLVYGRIGSDPDVLLSEAEAKRNQEIEASVPDWSAAYRAFILGGGFQTCGQEFGGMDNIQGAMNYESVRFGLYDLDQNGIPELLAEKGARSRAESMQYVYTYQDGEVCFLDNVGAYETGFEFAPGTNYHGLFTIWMQMGCGECEYITIENGAFRSIKVYSYQENHGPSDSGEPSFQGYTFTQETDDDALYQAARELFQPYHDGNGTEPDDCRLPMYSVAEIESMGWDAFAS